MRKCTTVSGRNCSGYIVSYKLICKQDIRQKNLYNINKTKIIYRLYIIIFSCKQPTLYLHLSVMEIIENPTSKSKGCIFCHFAL